MSDLSGQTTIVVGASRGLGRGIAAALAEAGAHGVIITLTASPARLAIPGAGGFGVACAAIEALTRTLAAELGQQGVPSSRPHRRDERALTALETLRTQTHWRNHGSAAVGQDRTRHGRQ
jgi:NAD(P)-dependent dehydrogenase (short-subunit alcohol dehydrogenase family)